MVFVALTTRLTKGETASFRPNHTSFSRAAAVAKMYVNDTHSPNEPTALFYLAQAQQMT